MNAGIIRYMRAHIRTHTGQRCLDWSAQELAESFLMLPEPAISPEDWLARVGDEPPAEAAVDFRAENQAIIEGIMQAKPRDVKVEVA